MSIVRLVFGAFLALAAIGPAEAQRRGTPGDFDYWVLVLSWSPSWCEAEGDSRRAAECARPFAFTVHGLWPQYERGYPADCDATARDPSRATVDSLLPIMPSPGLIRHEWRKHGTCSGLNAESYFNVVSKLFGKIKVPDTYKLPGKPQMVDPAKVETDFLAANPGMNARSIAVTCDGRRLREVRICLTKRLDAYKPCPEVDDDQCRAKAVYLPAVRGG